MKTVKNIETAIGFLGFFSGLTFIVAGDDMAEAIIGGFVKSELFHFPGPNWLSVIVLILLGGVGMLGGVVVIDHANKTK